jgi:two-component system, chemotaxis family, CheB/CheR fusion protein
VTRKNAPPPAVGKHASPPIVGIGASAGGINALNRFFGSMPADSGLAFVVVLHLDPRHHSELASILGAVPLCRLLTSWTASGSSPTESM